MAAPLMAEGSAPRHARAPAAAVVRSCGGCDFYQSITSTGTAGECRRRAPAVIVPGEGNPAETVWPRVSAAHWCGEFKGRA
jgi:hypothetical protein